MPTPWNARSRQASMKLAMVFRFRRAMSSSTAMPLARAAATVIAVSVLLGHDTQPDFLRNTPSVFCSNGTVRSIPARIDAAGTGFDAGAAGGGPPGAPPLPRAAPPRGAAGPRADPRGRGGRREGGGPAGGEGAGVGGGGPGRQQARPHHPLLPLLPRAPLDGRAGRLGAPPQSTAASVHRRSARSRRR